MSDEFEKATPPVPGRPIPGEDDVAWTSTVAGRSHWPDAPVVAQALPSHVAARPFAQSRFVDKDDGA